MALALHVSGVGENAAGHVLEAVPLLQEVVLAVIARGFDLLAVRAADLAHVGGVDHHFASIGHRRLHLVHALGRDPEIVVHLRHDREHALDRSIEPHDVASRREISRLRPGFGHGSAVDPRDAFVRHHGSDERQGAVNHARGAIDHGAHRGRLGTDDLVVGDERPEPVGEVDDLRAGDARKQVLGPAREAGHLVGEDRTADEHVVVVEQQPVQGHGHRAPHPASGQLFDLRLLDGPEGRESRGVVPAVVEDAPLPRFSVGDGPADEPGKLGVGERHMGPEGHEEIERPRAWSHRLVKHAEEQGQGHGPSAVRNQHQHALAVQRHPRERLVDDGANFVHREEA